MKNYRVENAKFIPLSALDLSYDYTSDIHGEADRTLYTVGHLLHQSQKGEIEFSKSDLKKLEAIIDKYGESVYIDVDN